MIVWNQYFAGIACKLLKQQELRDDLKPMFSIFWGQNIEIKDFSV
ncbi:MAG: hypothetical protein ABSE85_04050 [Candidatus Korobacteraceae bacterium]